MTNWSQRMAEAKRRLTPPANSADSAERSSIAAVGTIGATDTSFSNYPSRPVADQSALRALTAQRLGTMVPCSGDVTERAAIIAEGDHSDRAKADARALAEYGIPSWSALAGAHREDILEELARLPPASSEHVRGLVASTRAFLDSKHWRATVALGWELIEIFGVNPHAPLVRIDGQGLLTGLALSKLDGGRLETITASFATIRYRSGAVLTWRRGAAGLDSAVLWWKCAALVGSARNRDGGAS